MSDFPENYLIHIVDQKEAEDSAARSQFAFNDLLGRNFSYQSWRDAVMASLMKIASSKGGRALLVSIATTARWVKIVPLARQKCNADGKGARFIERGRYYTGLIEFDPQVYMSGSECYRVTRGNNPRWNRGALPDEVLFHELFHTYRGGMVQAHNEPLHGGLKRYDSVEEFYAVLLTNIYISDSTNLRKSGLRADHLPAKRPLEPELSHSFSFFQSSPQVLGLIDRLVHEDYMLARALGDLKEASFNPLKAYFDNYHVARAMSRSCLAKKREQTVPTLKDPVIPKVTSPAEILAKMLKDEALGILR